MMNPEYPKRTVDAWDPESSRRAGNPGRIPPREQWRRLLVVSGDRHWCFHTAGKFWRQVAGEKVWLGSAAPEGIVAAWNVSPERLLGRSLELVVFDAWSGFDPDLFGALCGTVVGGGCLLLLTPDPHDWPRYPDPQQRKLCIHPWQPHQLSNRFLRRLVGLIERDPDVVSITPETIGDGAEWPGDTAASLSQADRRGIKTVDRRWTRDQLLAMAAVEKVARGHRHRPAVLIADRGRGKSAVLGAAAARLVRAGKQHILVTAPALSATDALFEWAVAGLGGEAEFPARGRMVVGGAEIRFVVPDELLRTEPRGDVLLVDEAAGISLSVLEELLRRYSRVAFATTVHGYEGAGRGFAIRFRRVLDDRAPGWREVVLRQPVRHAENDPLERFAFRSLLLGDWGSPPDQPVLESGPVEVVCLERDNFLRDEGLLAEVFGLLVAAHYRTRPFDLRHMLDGPNVSVWLARQSGRVLGTALVVREGGIEREYLEDIFLGRRRLPGHLAAQSFSIRLGFREAPALTGDRVMRLAVHPQYRRRGIGSCLLTGLAEQARAEGCDWLASSFGAMPGVLAFWSSNRMPAVHLGVKRNANSGTHGVMVARGLSEAGCRMVSQAREEFVAQLPGRLPDLYSDLDPEVAVALVRNAEYPFSPTQRHWDLLRGFATAHRSYADSVPVLQSLILSRMSGSDFVVPDARRLGLLVGKVLQKIDWPTLCRKYGYTGRGKALASLREAVAVLLDEKPFKLD